MRIFTLSDRPRLSSLTRTSLQRYSYKFGHTIVAETKSLSTDRHISWSKIKMLQDVKDGEIAAWVDDDVVITNYDRDVFRWQGANIGGAVFLVSADYKDSPFNCGVMVVRGCAEFQIALQRVWNEALPQNLRGHWWEQSQLHVLYREKPEWFRIVPFKTLQSFTRHHPSGPGGMWEPGDFILHMAGVPLELRIAIVDRLFK